MPRQPQISITPTPELRQIITQQATDRGLSQSAVIREALLKHFAPQIAALRQQQKAPPERSNTALNREDP